MVKRRCPAHRSKKATRAKEGPEHPWHYRPEKGVLRREKKKIKRSADHPRRALPKKKDPACIGEKKHD